VSDDGDWFERALGEEATDDADDGDSVAPAESTEDADGDEEAGEAAPPERNDFGAGTETDAGFDGSGGDALFEDDFADAFASASGPEGPPAGDEFDMGGGGFDDEDFDSDIPRVDVGIEGLDSMIQGGVPERSLMVAIGSAGTGKSTLGLQFLQHALAAGERAVFIALEESREAVLASADERGWDFSGHAERGDLALVDLDPIEMANSLSSIRDELPDLVAEFGASRLVLDSVSLLEMMYDDQAERRTEIYDFTRGLEDAGVTTLLISEADETTPYASRFGIIEYLTDAVFVLQYIRGEDFRETRLGIEIVKIRNANHSREMKPYELTGEGIEVYRQANIF
jgi:circadian clock protein KaiC